MEWIGLIVAGVILAWVISIAWDTSECTKPHRKWDGLTEQGWKDRALYAAIDCKRYDDLATFNPDLVAVLKALQAIEDQCVAAPRNDVGMPSREEPWVSMGRTLALTRICGAFAPHIEVRPGCKVTGERGHITISEVGSPIREA